MRAAPTRVMLEAGRFEAPPKRDTVGVELELDVRLMGEEEVRPASFKRRDSSLRLKASIVMERRSLRVNLSSRDFLDTAASARCAIGELGASHCCFLIVGR